MVITRSGRIDGSPSDLVSVVTLVVRVATEISIQNRDESMIIRSTLSHNYERDTQTDAYSRSKRQSLQRIPTASRETRRSPLRDRRNSKTVRRMKHAYG